MPNPKAFSRVVLAVVTLIRAVALAALFAVGWLAQPRWGHSWQTNVALVFVALVALAGLAAALFKLGPAMRAHRAMKLQSWWARRSLARQAVAVLHREPFVDVEEHGLPPQAKRRLRESIGGAHGHGRFPSGDGDLTQARMRRRH